MITAMARPFLLVCGTVTFRLTSADTQRLLDGLTPDHAVQVTPQRVTFSNGDDVVYHILPATFGGGAAFEVTQ